MPGTNEAFSRVKIDAQLKDQGWDVLDINAVRFEYMLPDKTKADYVLCDRNGRALAVVEAKKAAINPAEAEEQAKSYAQQLKVPYVWSGSVGAFCALIRPRETRVLPAYLSYFLKSEPFRVRQSPGANIKNIRKSELEAFPVPQLTLQEQRQVVELLALAEGLVRLRREARAKAQAIIPALFIDMFGDPATNPNGWQLRPVRAFVARFEGGKNLQAAQEGSTAYRILKVSAVTTGQYIESESKPTPARYEPLRNHIVRAGDMLFSRANTQELVGATALVESTDGNSLLPDKLWRFVWAEEVEQRYMHALFQNEHVRSELGKLSSGTSASMRNISQGKLFDLLLPVAPIEMQRKFSHCAESMRSVLAQQSHAQKRAEAVFHSLLARTFSGELAAATPVEEAAVA